MFPFSAMFIVFCHVTLREINLIFRHGITPRSKRRLPKESSKIGSLVGTSAQWKFILELRAAPWKAVVRLESGWPSATFCFLKEVTEVLLSDTIERHTKPWIQSEAGTTFTFSAYD
jgi:hypothetical protein